MLVSLGSDFVRTARSSDFLAQGGRALCAAERDPAVHHHRRHRVLDHAGRQCPGGEVFSWPGVGPTRWMRCYPPTMRRCRASCFDGQLVRAGQSADRPRYGIADPRVSIARNRRSATPAPSVWILRGRIPLTGHVAAAGVALFVLMRSSGPWIILHDPVALQCLGGSFARRARRIGPAPTSSAAMCSAAYHRRARSILPLRFRRSALSFVIGAVVGAFCGYAGGRCRRGSAVSST